MWVQCKFLGKRSLAFIYCSYHQSLSRAKPICNLKLVLWPKLSANTVIVIGFGMDIGCLNWATSSRGGLHSVALKHPSLEIRLESIGSSGSETMKGCSRGFLTLLQQHPWEVSTLFTYQSCCCLRTRYVHSVRYHRPDQRVHKAAVRNSHLVTADHILSSGCGEQRQTTIHFQLLIAWRLPTIRMLIRLELGNNIGRSWLARELEDVNTGHWVFGMTKGPTTATQASDSRRLNEKKMHSNYHKYLRIWEAVGQSCRKKID